MEHVYRELNLFTVGIGSFILSLGVESQVLAVRLRDVCDCGCVVRQIVLCALLMSQYRSYKLYVGGVLQTEGSFLA